MTPKLSKSDRELLAAIAANPRHVAFEPATPKGGGLFV